MAIGRLATGRRLRRDRRGVVAIEMALIASAFIGMIVFAVFLSFRLYAQVALDYAASRAARMLAVDSTQALSRTAATFQAVTFCPLLARFLVCRNVVISLRPVTDYLGGTATDPPVAGGKVSTSLPFAAGQGGGLMLLQATYVAPITGFPWNSAQVVGLGSVHGVAVTANFPYQNEY